MAIGESPLKYLELRLRNEPWVAYPKGMRLPRQFASCYPFRGRGLVSRILYWLNKLGIDRLLLKTIDMPSDQSVALFWPASTRSTGRHYGYVVADGAIIEYRKYATTEDEQVALRREVENVKVAAGIANGMFHVPQCLGMAESPKELMARFEALPRQAMSLPVNKQWLDRVLVAQKQIADCGYMHGDFAWHNFKAVGNELWILDWEEMRKGGPLLSDEIALLFGLEYYWRKKPLKDVLETFRKKYEGSAWSDALDAVRDLQARKITMGDILERAFL